jgi:hypothetical protein
MGLIKTLAETTLAHALLRLALSMGLSPSLTGACIPATTFHGRAPIWTIRTGQRQVIR